MSRIAPAAVLHPAKSRFGWLKKLDTWLILKIMGGIVVALLLISGLSNLLTTSTSIDVSLRSNIESPALAKLTEDTMSVVLAGIAIVAIITAFVVGNRMKLVTFLAVTALLLFVVAQYQLGGLGIGYRREVLYLLAIAALVLVITYAVGKEKFTFGVLVGAIFALLGFSHIYTWTEFTGKMGNPVSLWSGGTSRSEPMFSTVTQCGVEIPTVGVSSSATLLTTGVKCDVTVVVVSGKVRVEGANTFGSNGYMDLGPSGILAKDTPPGWRAFTIRSLQADTKITGRLS